MSRRKRRAGKADGKNWSKFDAQKRARCNECKHVTDFWRHKKDKKATGHQKHMYCYHCSRVTKHTELGYANRRRQ